MCALNEQRISEILYTSKPNAKILMQIETYSC